MTRRARFLLTCCLAAVLAVLIGAASEPVQAQGPAWARAVDEVFAPWARPDSPGCALGVFKDGAVAYEHGYGMADLEHGVAITPTSVFYVGSLSKQFTAFAAAVAMDQGRLSPDDSIRKYLPELPDYTAPITVRHLLHHTSGLRDYNTLLSIAGRRGDEAYDNPSVLKMTARQKALNFAPGDEYLYSNTGYTLLAIIVERATGTPFAAFAEATIFKPLNMGVTHYHVDVSQLVPGRAMAYAGTPGQDLRLDTPSNQRAGAGGVYTNIPDLLRWDENFYDAKIGGRRVLERLQTAGVLNAGTPLTYGWGLELGSYRGLRIVEHGGSLGGYRAHLLRFPDQHTSVAVLCNLGSTAPSGLARRVADAVIGNTFTQPRPASIAPAAPRAPGVAATSAAAERPFHSDYAGQYVSDEVDSVFTVRQDGARVLLQRESDAAPLVLQPLGPDRFRAAGMTLTFERPVMGAPTALVIDAGRVRNIRFVRKGAGTP